MLELGRGPEAFHDLELATVGEAPPHDFTARADGVTRIAEVRVVDEEHAAVRFQRALDELAEELEAPLGTWESQNPKKQTSNARGGSHANTSAST